MEQSLLTFLGTLILSELMKAMVPFPRKMDEHNTHIFVPAYEGFRYSWSISMDSIEVPESSIKNSLFKLSPSNVNSQLNCWRSIKTINRLIFKPSVIVIKNIFTFYHSQAFLLSSHFSHKSLSCFYSCLPISVSHCITQDSTQTIVVVVNCFTFLCLLYSALF